MRKIKKEKIMDLMEISREMRRHIIEMVYRSKSAHVGSALCLVEILTVLFFRILNIRPRQPDWPKRDRFILSKGHGAAALYVILALKGFFPKTYLRTYCQDGGRLHGHPCFLSVPGIEASTGSLGHGLSIAAGIALGIREREPASNIYVLLGDGECNEGAVWEAAMFIATHQLKNIIVIIDNNKFQGFGATRDVFRMQLDKQWRACGWHVIQVDGHNLSEIEQKLKAAQLAKYPTVIIADTVAGKGVPRIENTLLAHYFIFEENTFKEALTNLYAT